MSMTGSEPAIEIGAPSTAADATGAATRIASRRAAGGGVILTPMLRGAAGLGVVHISSGAGSSILSSSCQNRSLDVGAAGGGSTDSGVLLWIGEVVSACAVH